MIRALLRRLVIPSAPAPAPPVLATAGTGGPALAGPAAPVPGRSAPRYVVTYDRIGCHGRGLPAPAPLSLQAATRDDLAGAIARDAVSYLPAGAHIRAVVDLAWMAGQLYDGDLRVGTFTLVMPSDA